MPEFVLLPPKMLGERTVAERLHVEVSADWGDVFRLLEEKYPGWKLALVIFDPNECSEEETTFLPQPQHGEEMGIPHRLKGK